MANTNDFELCKEYVMNYLETIKMQLNQCDIELREHAQSCPTIEKLSFDQIQQRLKEIVDRERNYLSLRNEDELNKFKDDIYEKQLFQTISTSPIATMINNQQVTIYIISNRFDILLFD